MNRLKSVLAVSTAVAALNSVASSAEAQQSAVLSFAQVGGNVVLTSSGSVDTSSLGYFVSSTTNTTGLVRSDSAGTYPIYPGNNFAYWLGMAWDGTSSNPVNFAPSNAGTSGSFSSGSTLAWLRANNDFIALDSGYVSGSTLAGSTTFVGHTLSSLGLNPGTYRWTYGGGLNEFKIVVPSGSAVPEPGEWAAMGILGAGLAGLVIRKRRMA